MRSQSEKFFRRPEKYFVVISISCSIVWVILKIWTLLLISCNIIDSIILIYNVNSTQPITGQTNFWLLTDVGWRFLFSAIIHYCLFPDFLKKIRLEINALIRYSALICFYFGVKVLILDKDNITQTVLLFFSLKKTCVCNAFLSRCLLS